ncbi:Inner membrane protein YohC [Burkholderiales bacterium]|nr:MAG: YIP1 family protein [Burkholderiales bacterium]CAG0959527.1 Inner membrane protein YohC [Burkholderiales bacterium]
MNLVERVKNILLSPKTEWPTIAGETTDVKTLYTSYVMILAAIPAVATFIGYSLIGMSMPMVGSYRVPIGSGIAGAIVQYGLALVGVYVMALIIDALAPSFGGEKNLNQALKTTAYSYTAAWVASIFHVIPGLGILSIVGLYSFYLLYLGLPVTMKAPQEKAVGYTAVAVICGIVLMFVFSAIGGIFIAAPVVGLSGLN